MDWQSKKSSKFCKLDFTLDAAFPVHYSHLTASYRFLNRMKVDLTKYIEEHLFSFDNAYSDEADN